MKRLASMILLCCFALISVSASYGASAFENPSHDHSLTSLNVKSSNIADHEMRGSEIKSLEKECPCKKETTATKLVCGVALALSVNETLLNASLSLQARFTIVEFMSLQSFVDQQKRPPRTLL